MNKIIKSGVWEMLFRMISKFEEKQQEKEAQFNQKQDCLRMVLDFLENLENVAGVDDIVKIIEKITDLEQKDRRRTQNQYLDEIASITEVSVTTLKRIKKEGVVNEGVWNTPGKKRSHKPTVSNLDSFNIDAICNKINEFYIIRKQVPTLRTLLVELRESIGVNASIKIFFQYHTKAELLCHVKRNTPEPVYEADEILKQNGHEVLLLPPYHWDLHAIELVWSLAKRKVVSKNIALPAVELEKLIKEFFVSITPQEWKKMTDHVIHIENKYKERDRITEDNSESFIIHVGDSDSSVFDYIILSISIIVVNKAKLL